jgi:hypothetical protein
MKKKNRELGYASVWVELSKGEIRVFNGNQRNLLFRRSALPGDWDRIIKELASQ